MIKILHIIDGLGIGGAETWLVSLVKYCFETPYPIKHDFLCTGGEKRVFDDELEEMGSKLFYIKYSTKALPHFRRFTAPILNIENYTVIWNHEDYISGWQFLAMWGNLPDTRITYLHNPINQTWYYRTTLFRKMVFHSGRYLMSVLATHLTGTSDHVMNEYGYQYWPYIKKRIAPIHCAFDLKKFTFSFKDRLALRSELGLNEHDVLVLFIGRLSVEENNPFPNQKNPDFALRIAETLVKTRKDMVFVFVGEKGHSGDLMETRIRKDGLADVILFIGIRRDIPRILSAADVLIFPSQYEGLGMVAVEAQAAGLPVLLSDQVPEEAIVDASLVKRLPLIQQDWIDTLLEFKPIQRVETMNCKVVESDFNLSNCVHKISTLFS